MSGLSCLLLSIMFSSFIQVVACNSVLFLFTSVCTTYNTPFYVRCTICLCIHLLMDTWVVSTFWLLRINIHLQVSMWTYVFISLGLILLGNCWGTTELFPALSVPFYILSSILLGFLFLHILTKTCYFLEFLFYYSHPGEYDMASHRGFDLHFLNNQWKLTSLHVLFGHLYIFFEKNIYSSPEVVIIINLIL